MGAGLGHRFNNVFQHATLIQAPNRLHHLLFRFRQVLHELNV
jgi:hypothetical protein